MIQASWRWILPSVVLLLFFVAACEKEKSAAPEEKTKTEQVQMGKGETPMAQPAKAVAELKPTEGSSVTGTVTFTAEDGGVRVVADLEGLEPGMHGFHVHENGDCSAPDATSAGGHFNPSGTPHGAPDNPPAQRHVGDLGNLEAGADGKAHYERVDHVIALHGENSVVGKAVIVHAQADDLTSQPSGNAGPRVACGVIETSE